MNTLRLFSDVVTLRSFSEAALKNSITQSAVSQRIRHLEEQLGVELLDRSVRPFQPTPAGKLLALEGREIAQRYEDLIERVRTLEDSPSGEVRVDAIYSAGIGLLEGIRSRFEAAFPKVSVVLEYRRPEEVAEAVRQGTCDLGIISYPDRWSGVVMRPLRDELMCVVCRSGHPLAKQQYVRAGTLSKWPLVGFDPSLPLGRAVRSYMRQHGQPGSFAQLIDNIDTVKAVLRETDHIAILPQRTVLTEIEAGSHAAVALRPTLSRPMGILSARTAALAAPAEQFIHFLQKHAQAINAVDLDVDLSEADTVASTNTAAPHAESA